VGDTGARDDDGLQSLASLQIRSPRLRNRSVIGAMHTRPSRSAYYRSKRITEEDRVSAEIVQEMPKFGLFGISIPEEHGGLELTMEERGESRLSLRWRLSGIPFGIRGACVA